MYADDVVLMSETANGLQNSLDRLEAYCDKLNCQVNFHKTKIIIFNKGGYKINKFTFTINDTPLGVTQEYCNLGIVLSASGSMKQM